jgi:hypothetical protein
VLQPDIIPPPAAAAITITHATVVQDFRIDARLSNSLEWKTGFYGESGEIASAAPDGKVHDNSGQDVMRLSTASATYRRRAMLLASSQCSMTRTS